LSKARRWSNELVTLITEVTGEEPEVEYLPGRALDVTRAREESGWASRTELAEGIAATWNWVWTLAEHRVEQEV
jgi:nucleoside-diphosphate-sugar epimerase